MKVLFLIRSLARGGAERQLAYTAAGMKKRGIDVLVVTFYENSQINENIEYLLNNNVKIQSLNKKSRYDIFGFFRSYVSIIKNYQPTVLYSYLEMSNVLSGVTKLICRHNYKLVWGKRSADLELKKYPLFLQIEHKLEKVLSRAPQLIICNSNAGKQYLESLDYKSRLVVVPNGIDVKKYINLDIAGADEKVNDYRQNNFIFLAVGRHDAAKDYDILIRAFILAFSGTANVKLIIVGRIIDAISFAGLNTLLLESGVLDKVQFIDEVSNVVPYYSNADVFVSSSYTEGFSNVLLEAMLHGLPPIITDAGDNKIIAEDCGRIVARRDAYALSSAMTWIYGKTQNERNLIGANARQRIINYFSIQTLIDNTIKEISND